MLATIEIEKHLVTESRVSQVDFDNIPFGKVYSDHMFISDYSDGDWREFKIVPYQSLQFSPANATIHYGQSVFEGLKAYKNKQGEALIFRPMDNFRRLNGSAVRMCIPEIPEDIFMNGMTELIRLDEAWIPNKPGTSLYIRPFIFATDEYIGIRPSDNYKFIIFTCPVGAYYSQPVRVKIETEYSRAFEGGTGYAKAAGNYGGSLYPAKLAQEKGYDQLLWTDGKSHKYIEESGTMNVMFRIGDKLITAPAGDTILRGITRDSVLTLARDWGLTVEERKVEVEEIISAIKENTLNEAFGMGTAATIAHISTIAYDGVDYELSDPAKWEFSNRVLHALEKIRSGEEPDNYGWLHMV